MVTLEDLRALAGEPVSIELADGLVLDAEIVSVLDDQDHDQVWYRVVRVVAAGSAVRPPIIAGRGYATDLKEFVRVTKLPNP